jgi:rubrerythrin
MNDAAEAEGVSQGDVFNCLTCHWTGTLTNEESQCPRCGDAVGAGANLIDECAAAGPPRAG